MFALSAALTVLLLLEVVPSALAALTRFAPGVERLDSLTRIGLREGRRLLGASGRRDLLHTACHRPAPGPRHLAPCPAASLGAALEDALLRLGPGPPARRRRPRPARCSPTPSSPPGPAWSLLAAALPPADPPGADATVRRRSAAHGTVVQLAQDVGVPGVPAGLLDHVHQHPPHRRRRGLPQ